jgi:deazaflavin-dependent oxidoreductase (nitroreductase family)
VTAADVLATHAGDPVCDLETIGRRSGQPRRLEIWFATDGSRVYMLAGGRHRAHWVRNLRADPRATIHFRGGDVLRGRGRAIEGEPDEVRARQLVAAKYEGWTEGRSLSRWAAGSLPVEGVPEG